jgi:hypothetical protein
VPANVPTGEWTLSVRSQLDGRTVSFPVTVKAGGKLAALAKRGVAVEIRAQPAMTTYTVGYDPAPTQLVGNARVMRGEAIGTAVSPIHDLIAAALPQGFWLGLHLRKCWYGVSVCDTL